MNILKFTCNFFICASFLSVHLFSCQSISYKGIVDTSLNGYIFDVNVTDVLGGISMIGCFRKCCRRIAECQAFGYNEELFQCRLYNMSSFNLWHGVYEGSWKTYIRHTNDCPIKLGYQHDVVLNTCFKYYPEGTAPNIHAATVVCFNDGGHLLRITSLAIGSHIENYLDTISATGTIYVDGHRPDFSSTNWYFGNGEQISYFNWSPASIFNNTHRVYVKIKKVGSEWLTAGGDTDRGFLCQVDVK